MLAEYLFKLIISIPDDAIDKAGAEFSQADNYNCGEDYQAAELVFIALLYTLDEYVKANNFSLDEPAPELAALCDKLARLVNGSLAGWRDFQPLSGDDLIDMLLAEGVVPAEVSWFVYGEWSNIEAHFPQANKLFPLFKLFQCVYEELACGRRRLVSGKWQDVPYPPDLIGAAMAAGDWADEYKARIEKAVNLLKTGPLDGAAKSFVNAQMRDNPSYLKYLNKALRINRSTPGKSAGNNGANHLEFNL